MDPATIARTSSSFSRISISEPQIYGPRTLRDEGVVRKEERDKLRWALLAKIESCYGRVKLLRGVFDAGFCFGLLYPISNIVAGVSIAGAMSVDDPDNEPVPAASFPKRRKTDVIGDMHQRSLNGLVAFLAALFPYLTEPKAMWYLNKEELDPLVAARLIIQHRGMEQSFGFKSDTTAAAVELALRCAAAAAQHPCPKQFASAWKLLSHFLGSVATVLSGPCVTFDRFQSAEIIDILLKKHQPSDFSLEKSWDLASCRLLKLSPDLFGEVMGFPERSTMRRMLLATIHGYYLQALARLPKEKLRSQYHHSLLQAGHCYGPLDPVSNIILNTIWYSQAYPLTKKVDLEAISTGGLFRIAVRSFYGLVSFLCTRCATHLSPDQAMQRLQASGADLRIADPNHLDDDNNDDAMVSASVEQAYAAAAAAAFHPKPRDQAELLRPSNPMLRMASHYLKDGGKLSGMDADHLAECLFYSISELEQTEHAETNIEAVNKLTYGRMDRLINDFWNEHAAVVGMVPKYELHLICGVNKYVDGPVYTGPFTRIYHYSHINFLATKSAAEQVRCPYCEYAGSRVVHPAQGSFVGRGVELEKMWGGEELYSEEYTNDCIIACSREPTYWVDYLEDDCIYRSYRLDGSDEGEKMILKKGIPDAEEMKYLIEKGFLIIEDDGLS
uniref:PIR2-like helical domain-containing protein n=1 Tax=Aegilops tauschii TaxID=37682 RepID=M8D7V3_AEGTA